jgi:hypothetical protein
VSAMYAMSRDSLWFRDLAHAAGTNWALRHVVANEGADGVRREMARKTLSSAEDGTMKNSSSSRWLLRDAVTTLSTGRAKGRPPPPPHLFGSPRSRSASPGCPCTRSPTPHRSSCSCRPPARERGRGREAAASARAALLPEGGCRHAAGADGGPAGFHRRATRGREAVAATAILLGGVARLSLLAIPTWLPPLPPRAPTATRGGPPACRGERPAGDSRKKWRG